MNPFNQQNQQNAGQGDEQTPGQTGQNPIQSAVNQFSQVISGFVRPGGNNDSSTGGGIVQGIQSQVTQIASNANVPIPSPAGGQAPVEAASGSNDEYDGYKETTGNKDVSENKNSKETKEKKEKKKSKGKIRKPEHPKVEEIMATTE